MSEALAGDAGALLQVNPAVPGCAAAVGGKQLVINLKTAKALGMNVDASDLQGAKIIE